jgi:DNA-directed RNA polymerase specialized sigma24 family protein
VVFNARFARYRRLLHFVAIRVLGDAQRADEAFGNCWHSASRNPPRFEDEGAFPGWLVRVLIDEAFAIRRQRLETITATRHSDQATTSSNHSIEMAEILTGGTE